MSPGQKLHLKGLLEGSQKTDTTAKTPDVGGIRGAAQKLQSRLDEQMAPAEKPTSNLGGQGGIVDEIGKGTASTLTAPVVHPLATVKSMAESLMAGAHIGSTGNPKIDAQNEEAQQGQREELGEQGKEMEKDPAYTAGSVIGAALVTHGIVKGLPETAIGRSVGELKRSVGETMRNSAQSKFANDVPKKAIEKFTGKTEEVNEQSRVNAERGLHQEGIEHHSGVLDQKYEAAEKKAKVDNDRLWDKVRKKVQGAVAPTQPLREAAADAATKADPAQIQLFKNMMEGPPANPRIQTVDGAFHPGDPGYEDAYERMYGRPVPMDVDNISFDQAHRWYSWVTDKMYSGTRDLPSGTYEGLKQVREALNLAMHDMAKENGATGELRAARKSHTQMKEAFSDSPNQPATNASKSLQEESPEFQKQKSREARLEKVARYDPTVKDTAKEINNHRQALDNLPAHSPKPVPEAPDITAKTKEEMNANLKKYGATGQWVWRLIAGGALKAALHGSGAGAFAGDLLIGQAALRLFTGALRSDSILNWLAQPTADTMRRINELPPPDAQRLKMAMSALSKQELTEHPERANISINPAMAAWLGASQKPAKNRKEALDRKP